MKYLPDFISIIIFIATAIVPILVVAISLTTLFIRRNNGSIFPPSAPIRLSYWDTNMRCVYVNQNFANKHKTNVKDVIGKHVLDIVGPTIYLENKEPMEAALTGISTRVERAMAIGSDGDPTKYVFVEFIPHYENGKVIGFFSMTTDINERKDIHDYKRMESELSIRQAIANKQFVVYYQPQFNNMHQIIGAEALVRWNHPSRGQIPPGEFIPISEESGLIVQIGEIVLDIALKQLADWSKLLVFKDLTLAINVSAKQFHSPSFVSDMLRVIDLTGVNPSVVKLELTESALVKDIESVINKMAALKVCDVGFSLDDFGTGYSSLTYLKRMPLTQLKIDQSFVRHLPMDSHDVAIAKMIVGLAKTMGLDVIAEGVETREQRDFLGSIGCQSYQGFYYSRPLPIKEFEQFVKDHSRN